MTNLSEVRALLRAAAKESDPEMIRAALRDVEYRLKRIEQGER